MNKTETNKRIAKNSLMLYLRMLITMAVSLYTSRVVLNALGVNDFGVYNVVGGVVLLFSSLNTTMATAVQRFLNFEIGAKNPKRLNEVFNTSMIIHIIIALLVFVLLESIGVWFLNNKLNIPSESLSAANWVLQFSIFTFIVSVLSVPYDATIVANEHMKAFAYISIVEVTLKLLVAFSLTMFSFDKLKLYAVLMFTVSVILRLVYGIYSKRHFAETNFKWLWNRALFVQMISFAGWNLIGVSSTLIRTQGVNVVLNLFYGTVVNAAMGIAFQVKQAVDNFSNNFLAALNPQITKSFAAKEFDYLFELVFKGSKYAFFLVFLLTMPIIIESNYILTIWLKNVPEYTVVFVRLILINAIIESMSKTLIQVMFATGDIKRYQIIVGSVTILNLPISILFLYLNFEPQVTLIISIIIALFALFIRLKMLRTMVNFPALLYFKQVIRLVILVAIMASIVPVFLHFFVDAGLVRFILVTLSSFISVALAVFFIGLSADEQNFIISKIRRISKK